MQEAGFVVIIGSVVAATVLVIRAKPIGGAAMLGFVALCIAAGCLVAASFMPHRTTDPSDIPGLIVMSVGVIHFFVGVVLFAVSGFNRRRRDRRGDLDDPGDLCEADDQTVSR